MAYFRKTYGKRAILPHCMDCEKPVREVEGYKDLKSNRIRCRKCFYKWIEVTP